MMTSPKSLSPMSLPKSPTVSKVFLMTRFKKIIPILATALALSSLPAMAQQTPPSKPKVSVHTVEKMLIAPSIEVPGTIVSRNDAEISAEVAGRVAWVADEGAELAAGDVIARIDATTLKLDLAEAGANVIRLQADYDYQEREVARLDELAGRGIVPKSRLDETRSQRDMNRQSLSIAKIQRDRIKYSLDRTEVRVPFPGRVVERRVQVGEFTTVGRPVARFVDTVNIEVRAHVPVAAAPWISSDQLVEINHNGTVKEYPVRTVIPVGHEQSRTFEIRVKVEAADWIVGSAVRLAVPNGSAQTVIAAPRDALVIRASGITVFKIDDEGKAQRVQVKTGAGKADFIAIEGPVAEGDQLVVRGGEFLRPGQEVDILPVTS